MDNRYKINDAEIINETIDGEVMLLNLTNGNYFSLDNVGVLIWEIITQKYPVEALIKSITSYDVNSKGIMETSIQKVVSQMLEEGLIVHCDDDKNPLDQVSYINEVLSKLKEGTIRYEIPVLHMYKDIQEKYAHPCGVKTI